MTQAATLAQLASSGALSADTSGNVGIGTTSPVTGNSKLTVTSGITAQDGTTPVLQLYNSGAGVNQKYLRIASTTGGTMLFQQVNDAYTAATTQASIDASGIFSCNLTQSAASSGYVKLPSGIYIQWGSAGATTAGTTSNFPIAFPSTCWSLVAVNNNQTNPPAPSVSILSASQFRFTVSAGSPNCFYFAIGN